MRSSGTGQSPARTNGAGANGFSPALDRIPPQALEMEQAVIGCMMVDPTRGSVEAVRALLCPGDFYRDGHRRIYEAILRLDDAGSPTDMLSVQDDLERAGFLDLAGGMPYLMACGELVPSVTRAGAYAERVAETARLRTLIDVGGQLVGAAYEQQEPPEALIERFVGTLQQEQHRRQRQADTVAARAAAALAAGISAAELAQLETPEIVDVVPDLIAEGLSVLFGPPKLGKSYLAFNIALAVALGGCALGRIAVQQAPVLYLALEDTAGRLKRRLFQLCDDAKPPPGLRFYNPWLPLREGGLFKLEREITKYKPRLVFIDTFQKVRAERDSRKGVYEQDYSETGELKALADAFSIAIVVVHHTNKAKATDDPTDAASGSRAVIGGPDGWIYLESKRGSDSATLKVGGRETLDEEFALQRDDRVFWRLLGRKNAVKEAERIEGDAIVFAACGADVTPRGVAEAYGQSENTARQRIYRMVQRTVLRQVAPGKYEPTEKARRDFAECFANPPNADNGTNAPNGANAITDGQTALLT